MLAAEAPPPPSRPALVFVAELAARGSFATTAEADRPLRTAWCRARAVYPWVEAPLAAFAGWLADRVDITDPLGSLRTLEAPDLYLACALTHHDPGALRLFDEHLARIEAALLEARPLAPLASEVVQWLRGHALVDEEPIAVQRMRGPFVEPRPGVIRYGGERPFADWLQSLAIRRAFVLHQRPDPSPSAFGAEDAPVLRRPSPASSGGEELQER